MATYGSFRLTSIIILLFFLSFSTSHDWVIMSKLSASISPTPSTWKTDVHFCKWNGITCDHSKRVTGINVANKSLTGKLPADLNNLSRLKTLSLQCNSFSGELPTLANLTLLEEVYLFENSFTSIPHDFFVGLIKLQIFSISNNPHLSPWVLPNQLTQSSILLSFKASGASITGSIPDIFDSFPNLQTLKLSYNDLTGTLPASFGRSEIENLSLDHQKSGLSGTLDVISSMTQLTEVRLQANAFTGFIPDLSKCINLTTINFSKQKFSGTISPSFGNLTLLRSLSLNDNNLTGSIPKILASLPNLTLLDVSNNNLSGPIPEFPQKARFSFENNPLLGQTIHRGSPSRQSKGSFVSVGMVIGIVIGVLVFVGIVSYVCYYKCYQVPTKLQDLDHNKMPIPENGNLMISIQVLEQVTNHFSDENVLGSGGFGVVYKGELHDGTIIAVKKMKTDEMGTKVMEEFQAEIEVLTKVRHRHLVALIGYCINGSDRLLVYEYMPQGTLSQHLFQWREVNIPPLSWKQRVSIALDVGKAAEYLHNLAQQRFIHRDLKSANILLDNDMRAKVADFGLVRILLDGKHSVETRLAGTFGYLPPEYAGTRRVTTKVDVYAFGVVLMELITGRKALEDNMLDEICHLATWFRRHPVSKQNMVNLMDQVLEVNDEVTLESILKVAELACHCTADDPFERPNMGYVVNVLGPLVEKWEPTQKKVEYHRHHKSLSHDLHVSEDSTYSMLFNVFQSNSV